MNWIEEAKTYLNKDPKDLTPADAVSWAAHFSRKHVRTQRPPAVTTMLPILKPKANTDPMMNHILNLNKRAIEFINPDQTPILGADLPLFARLKMNLWHPSSPHTENNHLAMLGPLHTEMMIDALNGDWLEGIGWSETLAKVEVLKVGRSEAIPKSGHVTRSRYCHQVSALMDQAYDQYKASKESQLQDPDTLINPPHIESAQENTEVLADEYLS